jgi:hypothetical protein
MANLTSKQEAFVREYAIDRNAPPDAATVKLAVSLLIS